MRPDDCVQVAEHVMKQCPQLQLAGLMTIGMAGRDPTTGINPDFKVFLFIYFCFITHMSVQTLVECRTRIEQQLGLSGLELSMGMSDDFEHAIEVGSTNVRVGR